MNRQDCTALRLLVYKSHSPEPHSLLTSLMPHTESSPLLPTYNTAPGFGARVVRFLKAEGQPGWGASFYWYLFTSYFNVLLVFVPLSAVAHYLDWDAALRFGFSFLAIMPLAKVSAAPAQKSGVHAFVQLLGDATEQMSFSLGQTLAGLLNASFGNAVEIIVGVAALLQGSPSVSSPSAG